MGFDLAGALYTHFLIKIKLKFYYLRYRRCFFLPQLLEERDLFCEVGRASCDLVRC